MALTDNIVAYWKLDESSGDALDSVASFDLTNTGTVTYTTAKINNGAVFNGSSNYLTRSSDLGITTGSFSMFGWIKPDTLPSVDTASNAYTVTNNPTFLFKGSAGTANVNYYLHLKRISGAQYIVANRQKQNTSNNSIEYATTLSTSSYAHIGLTYDGTNLKLFLNGSQVGGDLATSGTGASGGSANTSIGVYDTGGTPQNYFDGNVDEVGMWSRALSSSEITELYNSGNGLQYPFVTSTDYPLTAAVGSFTLSGIASALKVGKTLIASAGSFIWSGIAAILTPQRQPTITADSPADTANVGTTLPTFCFTGTDLDGDDLRYQIQIDTLNTFDGN